MGIPSDALPIGLDAFCFRQFDDAKYSGTRIRYDKRDFVRKVNELVLGEGSKLIDGYAPFCKHIFVPNFVGAKPGNLRIADENRKLLQSGYVARRSSELPVLCRWFNRKDVEDQIKEAKTLDLILYSREQICKENAAMKSTIEGIGDYGEFDGPWSIISIKAQDEDYELPMDPITHMRNTLISEGGSGVELNREKYLQSVEYWSCHATTMGDE